MAHVARRNLRLQKELKILLTDPPPGASFPSLSSSSSLSSLDAEIEGPQDTVYANGVFKLKIQIPDRYPFQPPIVTFATPIYHPNIDSGGRICLDILNLPPKGAWQPSLNISTVLTSIGLLLCEPNPDDGLMHEASKKYKYNRQTFDQKAKHMTEKYARPIESENASADEGNQLLSNAPSLPMEDQNISFHEANEGFVNNNSICGTNQKLSLDYSGTNERRNSSKEADEESVHNFADNQMDTGELEQISDENEMGNGGLKQITEVQSSEQWRKNQQDMKNLKPQPFPDSAERISDCINTSTLRLLRGDKKLMLQSVDFIHGAGYHADKFTALEQSAFLSHSSMPHQTVSWTQVRSQVETLSHNGPVNRNCNDIMSAHPKKLGLAGRRPCLGLGGSLDSQLQDGKENLISSPPCNQAITFSMPSVMPEVGEKENIFATSVSYKKLHGITCKRPLIPLNQLHCTDANTKIKTHSKSQAKSKSNPLLCPGDPRPDQKLHCKEDHDKRYIDRVKQVEEFPVSDSIVVLDSEDSEDEAKVCSKSKFLLARKRLLEKWKAKVESQRKVH